MFLFEPEVFLTEQDPNYRIKGSRDPLGFQPVWTRVGRQLIRHLSSVSTGIRDFQTLLYGRYLFDQVGGDRVRLLKFFLKFEQASGYARRLYLGKHDTFNGTEYVDRVLGKDPATFYCSTSSQDQLLSNQKAYGIWGKYSRPFRDMQFMERDGALDLISTALKTKANFHKIMNFAERLYREERTAFSHAELEELSKLYLELTPAETTFFEDNLLQVPGESHLQNEFYQLLVNHPELIAKGSFHLFNFLENALEITARASELHECFKLIRDSEKVLFRHNSIFRGLQTHSVWSSDQINNDTELIQFNLATKRAFRDAELDELNSHFAESVFETAQHLAQRNKDICSRRGKANWISFEGNRLMVYYREGGGRVGPDSFDNSYFIQCYISLFRQVKGSDS